MGEVLHYSSNLANNMSQDDIKMRRCTHYTTEYFCPVCGREIQSDTTVCPTCGSTIVTNPIYESDHVRVVKKISALVPDRLNAGKCTCAICGLLFTSNDQYIPTEDALPKDVKESYLYKDPTTRDVLVGEMPINSDHDIKLEPDSEYTIPLGYHSGNGKVYTDPLSEYTQGTATASDIARNKTAWIDGQKIVGTLDLDEEERPGDATPKDLVEGKVAWVEKTKIVGTIPSLPRQDVNLSAGDSYSVPYGLHPGTSIISARSLASQTPGDITEKDVLYGKRAWSNGEQITGSLDIDEKIEERLSDTNALQSQVLGGKKFYSDKYKQSVIGTMPDYSGANPVKLVNGQEYLIPAGYHNGESKVYAQPLSEATPASADSNDILEGRTAWANGVLITGSIEVKEGIEEKINAGESAFIPAGYYRTDSIIEAESLEAQTSGNAVEEHLINGETAWVNGEQIIGSMSSHEFINIELDSGTHYHIPEGYHDGNGWVWAKSIEDETQGDAVHTDIVDGKIAWVNGKRVVGSMTDNGAVTAELIPGAEFIIPAGYHNGEGKVTASGVGPLTPGNATPANILQNKTAWVNGKQITGEMYNNGSVHETLYAGEYYDINEGYHDGTGRIITKDLASQTAATASENDILASKTAWVNGEKIRGSIPTQYTAGTMLNAGESITFEAGYYPHPFTVAAKSLEGQTVGSAAPETIIEGETAWVNGEQITGTMINADTQVY